MLQAMLRWGKHAGRAFADVAATDWPYVASVLREKAEGKRVPCELKAFANYIHVVHGGVLEVGKHRGRSFHDIVLGDPDYGRRVASLESPSKLLIDFHEYVKQRQKRRPRDTGDGMRNICMDKTIDSAFILCGHQTSCTDDCSRILLARGPCPICREPIADVLQTYFCAAFSCGAPA